MRCLVTGVAGFIGSRLAERLLELGYKVLGIDKFSDYYPRFYKELNVRSLLKNPDFNLIEADLLSVDLEAILSNVDYVFHEAAQPGVRASWGRSFEAYLSDNVLATQRLLEHLKGKPVRKLIYASSSSIYGDAETLPTQETVSPKPISPYGVTKLAAENLCYLYHKNYQIPFVALRYFTTYGPRQRPDMAFHKFIVAALQGREVTIYGDGSQSRDFIYVDDVVEASVLAMEAEVNGETINVGTGASTPIKSVIKLIEDEVNVEVKAFHHERFKGDVKHTCADISKARKLLGFKPSVGLREGLKREVAWLVKLKQWG
ncbi:MAG: NAD-dependent epimerase/dehydratase family protein [Candidatus Nezhaarchaeales archaeon]